MTNDHRKENQQVTLEGQLIKITTINESMTQQNDEIDYYGTPNMKMQRVTLITDGSMTRLRLTLSLIRFVSNQLSSIYNIQETQIYMKTSLTDNRNTTGINK